MRHLPPPPPRRRSTCRRRLHTATSPGSMAPRATRTPCSIRKFFTPEIRFDTHFMTDFNQPSDHTMGGSTESFRSGEVQMEQVSVGGDFHWQNVRGRILTMFGLFATTTPRNDASAASRPMGLCERLQICFGSLRRISLQREPRTQCRCGNLRVVHRPVQLLQFR